MKRDSIKRVAYHEAGHALTHWVFGFGIRRVSVIPGVGNLGHVLSRKVSRQAEQFMQAVPQWEDASSRMRRASFHDMAVCLLAGAESERRFARNRFANEGRGDDHKQVVDILCKLHSKRELPVVYKWLTIRAQELVALPIHAHAIKALAAELMRKRELSGKEAVTAMRAGRQKYMNAPAIRLTDAQMH